MTAPVTGSHVVFYDGVCGLCDRTVQFLLRVDRERVLFFAPLQGETAKRLSESDPRFEHPETVLLVEHFGTDREQISARSTAALRSLRRVGGAWSAVSLLLAIPRPLRDFVYRIVARYRYRWFGRFDACRIPDKTVADRFLN